MSLRSQRGQASVLVAGAVPPAPDAQQGLDAKAGAVTSGGVDPRVHLLLGEVFRQAKAIGTWGAKGQVLAAAGLPEGAPGVVSGKDAAAVVEQVVTLMKSHRAWERFPVSGRL